MLLQNRKFEAFNSVLFNSVLFNSVLFDSVLFEKKKGARNKEK